MTAGLVTGCSPAKEQNRLSRLVGKWQDKGTFYAGKEAYKTEASINCVSLGKGDVVRCIGVISRQFTFLDVYEWNAKTGEVALTSLNNLPKSELITMRGSWDSTGTTLNLRGAQRTVNGAETPVRSTREFLANQASKFKYYITEKGTERLIVEVDSQPR
jgi:hypothetical protein